MMAPPIGTVVAGVNTRTGATLEPAILDCRLSEEKVTAVAGTMAGAGTVLEASVSDEVDNVKVPAA